MCPRKFGTFAALTLLILAAACSETTAVSTAGFLEAKLVADSLARGAAVVDSDLVNPWGLAFGPTGILWVSDNHTGKSTLYRADGTKLSTVVKVPSSTDSTGGGAPTGVLYNGTSAFVIPGSGAALFIFAGEDGILAAWNATTGNAKRVANRSATGAVYKGLAMATSGAARFLYATNFRHDAVDVFDSTFQFVKSFTDPGVPPGFAPFGIATVGGELYVTFAKRLPPDSVDDAAGPGNGYVDIFQPDGTLAKRFASQGTLNSPWAVAVAPSGFGALGGDILIGNFGDGRIGAYNPDTGTFLGLLRDATNAPIVIDGLWGLTFGPTTASTTLYFAAGPNGENHGLLGTLTPH